MRIKNNLFPKRKLSLFLVLSSFISFCLLLVVSASVFNDSSESDFNNGDYDFTFYNSSGFIQLNASRLNGTYTSQVFGSALATWNNISFFTESPYNLELPNNQEVETGDFLRGANMTGNVLLYHLNNNSNYGENDTHIYDFSGSGNNGTWKGSTGTPDFSGPISSGKFDGGFLFDGDVDYILTDPPLGQGAGNLSSFTVQTWVNMDRWGNNWDYIIYRGTTNGISDSIYVLSASAGGKIAWSVDGDYISGESTTSINSIIGSWNLLTGVFNGTHALLYLNGEIIDSYVATYPFTNNANSNTLGIGTSGAPSPTRDFNGTLDEVAIWNRSLSTQEIQDIYKRGILKFNLSIQSCNDSLCDGESLVNLGDNLTSSVELGVDDNSYFKYRLDLFSENVSYSPKIYNMTIDYDLLDSVSPIINLTSPSNGTITNSQDIQFNFTATDETSSNLNCSLYIGDNLNVTNSTTLNNTLTSLSTLGLTEGLHNWTINCSDSSLNSNVSETRFFSIDLTPPSITNISYSPNSTDDVDPSTNITFNASISDSVSDIGLVILQYFNGSSWNNVTMSNSSLNNYGVILPLSSVEANYTFNVWTNDSSGNSNSSSNSFINSSWDCTWINTEDLGQTAGWSENKFIGNLTINNTGDSEHSSGCELSFRLNYVLAEGRIYFDDSYFKPSDTYTISPKDSQVISVNATFLTEIKQENEIITINEISSLSSNSSKNTTATILSNQNGPYLYQTITSYPTSVYLTNNNISLQGYLRNLMGSSTINENNTAYNVTFYWTLPSGFTNSSGNLTSNYTNITNNNLNYNNIDAGFSDLASMTSGVKTFYLSSYGYNLSGDLIQDANGNLNLTDSINISFLCYNVSDGVCVTSCGYIQDSDCSAPTTTTTTPSSSGGGGGGGGGTATEVVRTSADFQLIRGEQNEVNIVFENRDKNQSLRDLTFSVSGKIAKYTDIFPKQIFFLDPEQKINVTLTITSPTYIEIGKQELIITMEGKKGASAYTDSKKITLEIHELSVERANEMLEESRKLIGQLNDANLSYSYLDELLNESESAFEVFNLELVRDNYNIIREQVKFALDSIEIINELEYLIKSAEKKGIDVSESSRLVKLSKISIERREFEQAYSRVKDSQLTYALEVKGEFGKLDYYIKEYPGEISLAVFFLIIFSFGTYKIDKLRRIKKKIRELKNEEKILNELIRIVQKECFKDKKMSMEEYETVMKEYNKKLSSVVEGLIEMETKRVHLIHFTSKGKLLRIEKQRIIELIKELQQDYMKKRKLETRTFELKTESFNKRLSEIEEKLATLEAKRATKGLGLSLRIPDVK